MTRRDFFQLVTAISAAGAALSYRSLAAPAAEPRKRKIKKGFWYAAAPGNSPLEKFKAIKDAGFEGVEPPSHLNREEVLRARDETGLAIPSVSCGQHSRGLSSASTSDRAQAVEGIRHALQDAKLYGATSVLVVPGRVTAEISYDAVYQHTQEELRKVVPLAEELGVKLAFENVWNNFLLSPMEAARYVDEFNSPAVGWQFDVGNILYLGWPEHWIRILGRRILKVHIKEFSRKKANEEGLRQGFAVEFTEGDCNWPAVMKALDDIGYSGWAIVEPAWKPKDVDEVERLRKIADKVDKILAL